MKKFIAVIIAAMTAGGVSAQQPTQLRFTLEQCLEYAMGNNYTRAAMELGVLSAEIARDQSRMERLPSISASAGQNLLNPHGGSYGASGSMTLYGGGAIDIGIQQSRLQAEQTAVRAMQYDNALTINIMVSYFALLGYEELMRYQESLIAAGEAQVREGQARFEQEAILYGDYLMLEAQLASNRNSAEDTRINRRNELMTLKGLLSMALDAPLAVVMPDTTAVESLALLPVMEYYLERAAMTLPDLELLDYSVELAETNLRLSRSNLMPSLSLSGGLNTGYSGNVRGWGTQVADNFRESASLSLSVPIFTRGRTRASIRRSEIALQQAELDRLQGELDIRRMLTQNYHNVEAALNNFRTLTAREKAYGENLRVFREQFAEGRVRPVDMLQQENNYISIMYDNEQSKYRFMLQRKILDVYMGMEITM